MEVDEVLAQFGCMQTQDKEELVNQMLRLVGTNINYTTARFYLEMNQWNVQAAVCSYFDLETVNSSLPGWCLAGSVGEFGPCYTLSRKETRPASIFQEEGVWGQYFAFYVGGLRKFYLLYRFFFLWVIYSTFSPEKSKFSGLIGRRG